ncbi:MAG: hypothetical protein GX661_03855 [Acholeplasmataceae bacterium]|nr:hypothetical protein [Acholeplasmataceae bacterium]
MRKEKIIVFILISFLLLGLIFFTTDYLRVKDDKSPVFAFQTVTYDDGGSIKHTGLLYNIYYLHYFNPDMSEDWFNPEDTIKDEYKDQEFICDYVFTSWFVSIDKVKRKYQ